MIFDGKILTEISDDEISSLVKEHQKENQHLEYKLTINHKTDDDRLETLCDITSIANAGGGYLIIGIRDDGKGKAQKFESLTNPDRILKSVQSLCVDYISERIDGIEWDIRQIDSCNIILIRIPNSIKTPHMVSYQNNTYFPTRYNDGKREMTIGEIRLMFIDNIYNRKLSNIEEGLKFLIKKENELEEEKLVKKMLETTDLSILSITDGNIIAKTLSEKRFKEIRLLPYFEISITPKITTRNLINVDKEEFFSLIQNPPNQRQSGWNMEGAFSSIKRFSEGLVRTFLDRQKLSLLQNGHMDFYTILDESFYWKQSKEEYNKNPWLYPYAVIEYPLSFLTLYKEIIKRINFHGELVVSMRYMNIKNHILLPYSPGTLGYMTRKSEPYSKDNLVVPPIIINEEYSPDINTFELVKYVYNTFGYTEDKIPFYNKDLKKFIIA